MLFIEPFAKMTSSVAEELKQVLDDLDRSTDRQGYIQKNSKILTKLTNIWKYIMPMAF